MFLTISINLHKPMSVEYIFSIAGVFTVAHIYISLYNTSIVHLPLFISIIYIPYLSASEVSFFGLHSSFISLLCCFVPDPRPPCHIAHPRQHVALPQALLPWPAGLGLTKSFVCFVGQIVQTYLKFQRYIKIKMYGYNMSYKYV